MSDPLRLLLLEDSDEDAFLVSRALRKAQPGCDVHRVVDRVGFLSALAEYEPDLVISDHRLGDFSGMHALETVLAQQPDVPFIFVTGSLDEDAAAECVRAGAWDYVTKDRLVRLESVIASALELRRTRRELEQSQGQLRQSQKLDALGRLAGAVAHDYNNLMTAVLGYAHLVAETLDTEDERRVDLAQVTRAADRAADLSKQLLTFSRKQVLELRAVSLNDVLRDVELMLKTLMGEQVGLVMHLAADLPAIRSDAGQLEQLIVNLAINGRDAMPTGGVLTIETQSVATPDETGSSLAEPRRRVRMEIRDTGTGMDAETLEHIFEPFFTTKPRGRGTGLGLATAYGIVRQAHGEISVRSTMGAGTVFRTEFPAATVQTMSNTAETLAGPMHLAGTETILVLEDEEAIRAVARRVLASYGYRVIEAATLRAAMQVDAQEPQIDLLLADLVLPDGNGVELAEHLRRNRPALAVLYMSGYAEDDDARTAAGRADAAFMEKPFTPVALVKHVRDVLNHRLALAGMAGDRK